ncbi:hypothetical protein D1007_37911 [Hordeum vulgare]|nr:hypothetical protein D1007_37911 [Hordeum vulgare]
MDERGEVVPLGAVVASTDGWTDKDYANLSPEDGSTMGRLVNVHYMNKEAFLTNNADGDEEAIVFDRSPSYDELVAKVRHVLNWMDPDDGVKLIGRYDVGVGVKSRLKSMPITSDLHWDVYKEQVEKSDDKSIELFATKVEPPRAD